MKITNEQARVLEALREGFRVRFISGAEWAIERPMTNEEREKYNGAAFRSKSKTKTRTIRALVNKKLITVDWLEGKVSV